MTTPHLDDRPLRIAAIGLDHLHVLGQMEGMLCQGCELVESSFATKLGYAT